MEQYPLERCNTSIVSTFMQVDSDHSVACPTHRIARLLAARGIAVYAFEFAHFHHLGCDPAVALGLVSKNSPDTVGWATHGSDVKFTFGTTEGINAYGQPVHCEFNAAEQALSLQMQQYWIAFAQSGVPTSASAGVAWPLFVDGHGTSGDGTGDVEVDAAAPFHVLVLEVGSGLKVKENPHAADCLFWDRLK